MVMGERLRALREAKRLSQGDVEARTGLLRCYVSRVEHGHTVPAVETLEKFARALEVPLYQLFYGADQEMPLAVTSRGKVDKLLWGSQRSEARYLSNLRRLLAKMSESNRRVLLSFAQGLARR